MLHKTRDLLVRQRTMLINALRGHLTAYGIVSAQGAGGVRLAIEALHEGQESLPMSARFALQGLVSQLRSIEAEIEKIEAEILKWHRSNEASRRLATINAARTTGAGGKALGGPSTMIDHLLEWRTQSTFR